MSIEIRDSFGTVSEIFSKRLKAKMEQSGLTGSYEFVIDGPEEIYCIRTIPFDSAGCNSSELIQIYNLCADSVTIAHHQYITGGYNAPAIGVIPMNTMNIFDMPPPIRKRMDIIKGCVDAAKANAGMH